MPVASGSTPSSSTLSESSPSALNRRGTFFSRRFSNASLASVDTYHSILPQYSATNSEPEEHPPAFDEPSSPIPHVLVEDHLNTPSQPSSPSLDSGFPSPSPSLTSVSADGLSRHSYINPRYSTILTSTIETANPVQAHEFEYAFPIRSNKPWATLHLFARDSITGNPAPTQAKHKTPRFWGSEPIAGMLELDLEAPQTIQQISITVKGKIVTGSFEGGSYTFFNHEIPLWSKLSSDPRTSPLNAESSKGKFDGKFVGEYKFPFSFPFPNRVDLSTCTPVFPPGSPTSLLALLDDPTTSCPPSPSPADKGKKRTSRRWSFNLGISARSTPESSSNPSDKRKNRVSALPQQMIATTDEQGTATIVCPIPQSVMEGRLTVNVEYELSVHIVHSRFRPDSKIKTSILYVPAIMPPPASTKRQQAYEAGGFIPGPASDPNGWFALPKATIQGEFGDIFGRQVQIDCTLYLAKPLSYTRGTVIPCYLTIASQDGHALKALCKPKSPHVRLSRRIRHFTPHGGAGASTIQAQTGNSPGQGFGSFSMFLPSQAIVPVAALAADSGRGSDLKTVVHEVGLAVWWVPTKDVAQQTHVRHLEGEIHLGADLQPSCACTIFSVEYFVEMLPLRSSVFEVEAVPISGSGKGQAAKKRVIVSQPVEVATLYRPDGPMPTPFSQIPKTRIRSLSADTIQEESDE